jgi:hypothetical protein
LPLPTAAEPAPLLSLPRGRRARLDLSRLDPADRSVLRAMGLRADCEVQLCRVGEPCILALRGCCNDGCRIGLTRRLAERVLARPID